MRFSFLSLVVGVAALAWTAAAPACDPPCGAVLGAQARVIQQYKLVPVVQQAVVQQYVVQQYVVPQVMAAAQVQVQAAPQVQVQAAPPVVVQAAAPAVVQYAVPSVPLATVQVQTVAVQAAPVCLSTVALSSRSSHDCGSASRSSFDRSFDRSFERSFERASIADRSRVEARRSGLFGSRERRVEAGRGGQANSQFGLLNFNRR